MSHKMDREELLAKARKPAEDAMKLHILSGEGTDYG